LEKEPALTYLTTPGAGAEEIAPLFFSAILSYTPEKQ
jgi:hypothetical protein